jgi:hypothetical protein
MVSWHSCTRGMRGVALLVLRGSVTSLILIGTQGQHLFAAPSIVTLAVGAIGVGLCLGILTVVCAITAIAGGVSLFMTGHIASSYSGVVTLCLCSVVSILGPGAYSLDCVLFGRRKIVLQSERAQSDKAAS